MQIRIVENENGLREALFIELQGTFEIDGDLSGDAFGEVLWRGKERTPLLFIQHQMYVGEVKTMKKPFLIMDRRTVRDDPERAGDKKVDIVGIVRRKLVFKHRPRPIINEPTTTK
ncbi:replication factor C complex [Aphelenchoides avenae]|nr:replication factor C complex [Aphelenchus avenae]